MGVRENALLVGDTGVVEAVSSLKQEGISEMNATSTRSVVVEAGGTQVVGHVGLHALGAFADRLGVPMVLSDAVGWDGDAIEAQAFAFLAVRSLRGLPLSLPSTTGVPQPMTGGKLAKAA